MRDLPDYEYPIDYLEPNKEVDDWDPEEEDDWYPEEDDDCYAYPLEDDSKGVFNNGITL